MDRAEISEFLSDDLRLRSLPVAVNFLKALDAIPEGARRPSKFLGKRITICQAVTMARLYGWTIALTKDDLICVPAMITFGFTRARDQVDTLAKLFCSVTFSKDPAAASTETGSMNFLPSGEYQAMVLAPLAKTSLEPDAVAIYGNPAQVMRLIQAWTYLTGMRVAGNFGGKIECSEYLTAPFKTSAPRISIPGNGDRIFSMTQDDEMVFSLPGRYLNDLAEGLKTAGKKIGARYPITFYQNFQPEFPKIYKELGEELGAF